MTLSLMSIKLNGYNTLWLLCFVSITRVYNFCCILQLQQLRGNHVQGTQSQGTYSCIAGCHKGHTQVIIASTIPLNYDNSGDECNCEIVIHFKVLLSDRYLLCLKLEVVNP